MEITKFKDLLLRGFDVEFNINDVFHSFTSTEDENKKKFYIGNENHSLSVSFDLLDDLINFKINKKTVKEIVEATPEEEIYY